MLNMTKCLAGAAALCAFAVLPAVGPCPASFEARIFATLSISPVQGPAAAVPADKARKAQLVRMMVDFMAFLTGSPASPDLIGSTQARNARSALTT